MICPTIVPTLIWKDCSSSILITTDGYKFDTGGAKRGFGFRHVKTDRPKYKITNIGTLLYVRDFMRFHRDTIADGTAPFALYGDWGGAKKWYVVQLVNPNVSFDYKAHDFRNFSLEVHILGYANDVTEPTAAEPLKCDDGDTMTGEGDCDMWCVPQAGTATDIVCI